jgi:hypothetical protein
MLIQRKQHMSWTDTAGLVLHTLLACLEMGMMMTAVPLWFVLPGAIFAAWVCVCAAMVMVMCWMLNGREQTYQCPSAAGSEGLMMGHEVEDERWLFLGGIGMRSVCHLCCICAVISVF